MERACSLLPGMALSRRRQEKHGIRGAGVGVALTLLAACTSSSPVPADAPANVLAAAPAAAVGDHHAHILSPQLVADWKSLGVPFSRPDSMYTSATALHVEDVQLIPMAHLYGNEDFRRGLGLSLEQEAAAVRRENEHVAREAQRFPGRAVAYCSADIKRPYFWNEIRRCRNELSSMAVKVHLASAGFDPRRSDDLALMAAVAAWADSNRVALLVHFDPQRSGIELEHVRDFIEQVIAPYPQLAITIAHMGGSGGYGEWSRSVYRTFASWLREEATHSRARAGVYFDLSAVWLENESEGVPASTATDGAALARDMVEFGVNRLLLASDYPVFDPARAYAALRAGAAVDSATWVQLQANRFPVLRDAPRK